MTKKLAIFLFLLCVPMCVLGQNSGRRVKYEAVYMFGVAMNFADSTIYMTAVGRVDSVAHDASQGVMMNRYAYSEQLNQYLYAQADKRHETCAVLTASSRAKAEKQYLKIRRRIVRDHGAHNLVEIPANAFFFRPVPAL